MNVQHSTSNAQRRILNACTQKFFTGCVSGASAITEIEKMLRDAGFDQIEIKPKDESKEFIQNWVPDSKIEDYVVSATIEAIKPEA